MIPPYVGACQPGKWWLCGAEALIDTLAAMPVSLSRDGDHLILSAADNSDTTAASVADQLRSLGFYFSAGRDWSPVEYVCYLRSQGLIAGPVPEIGWTGLDAYQLRDA